MNTHQECVDTWPECKSSSYETNVDSDHIPESGDKVTDKDKSIPSLDKIMKVEKMKSDCLLQTQEKDNSTPLNLGII